MSVHECVCFVLVSGNQVLFEHRQVGDRTGMANINIPGGHIKPGESQQQTLLREAEEELGIIPLSYRFLCSQPFKSSTSQLLHYYLVNEWRGEVMAHEAEKVEWLIPSQDLNINQADRRALQAADLLLDIKST